MEYFSGAVISLLSLVLLITTIYVVKYKKVISEVTENSDNNRDAYVKKFDSLVSAKNALEMQHQMLLTAALFSLEQVETIFFNTHLKETRVQVMELRETLLSNLDEEKVKAVTKITHADLCKRLPEKHVNRFTVFE